MRPHLSVLLLLLTCQLATSIPIFDRDGTGSHGRSAGFGETIRDWFKVIKDRIVGKWNEWFGSDDPTPRLSPQDILTIDKTLEKRVPGYPGFFLDLSTLAFDLKRDWGVRIGNWYIIRKVAGSDSDSDEWDFKSLPDLPPVFGIDWPDFRKIPTRIPEATESPMTTPKIESTTLRRQTTQTVTQTPAVLTSIGSTATTTETTVTSIELSPLTPQLITTSTEPIVTSTEEILTSSEFVTNTESVMEPTESNESTTESTDLSIELSIESTSSIEPLTTSVRSIETSIESTVITTEAVMTSTEELTTITTTESPETSTELNLPSFNKRVEDNETVNKRTTQKPRPASAEVIMF